MTAIEDELRTLFLFEALTAEQVRALADVVEARTYGAGAGLARQGEAATHLFVLVEGRVRLTRVVEGQRFLINETAHRGAYGGAISTGVYLDTLETTAPSRLLRIPCGAFAGLLRNWFPMAAHLLEGVLVGIRSTDRQAHEVEQTVHLAQVATELRNEILDPAAAALAASVQVRRQAEELRAVSAQPLCAVGPAALRELQALSLALTDPPGDRTDLEFDVPAEPIVAIEALLACRGMPEALRVAGSLAEHVPEPAWISRFGRLVEALDDDSLPHALAWLTATVELIAASREVEAASRSVCELVSALSPPDAPDRPRYADAGTSP